MYSQFPRRVIIELNSFIFCCISFWFLGSIGYHFGIPCFDVGDHSKILRPSNRSVAGSKPVEQIVTLAIIRLSLLLFGLVVVYGVLRILAGLGFG